MSKSYQSSQSWGFFISRTSNIECAVMIYQTETLCGEPETLATYGFQNPCVITVLGFAESYIHDKSIPIYRGFIIR